MSTQWQIQDDYLESCTCKGACPCIYLEPPTEGDCSALVGWHIKKGAYGEVALDDLNIALALNAPGPMAEGNWKVVLYLDQRADEHQQEALGNIFGGKAGGQHGGGGAPAARARSAGAAQHGSPTLGLEHSVAGSSGRERLAVVGVGRGIKAPNRGGSESGASSVKGKKAQQGRQADTTHGIDDRDPVVEVGGKR